MNAYLARTPKIAPSHPGDLFKSVLEECRVSRRKAANVIGVSEMELRDFLAGKVPITADLALLIGAYVGNGPELWLNMQQFYDLWHARKRLEPRLAKIAPLPDPRRCATEMI